MILSKTQKAKKEENKKTNELNLLPIAKMITGKDTERDRIEYNKLKDIYTSINAKELFKAIEELNKINKENKK